MSFLESTLLVFMGYAICRAAVSIYYALPAMIQNERDPGKVD